MFKGKKINVIRIKRSLKKKHTQKVVVNIVKHDNLTGRFVCCNIHFQKYPFFFAKLFKYNRNSEKSGRDSSNSDILTKRQLVTG